MDNTKVCPVIRTLREPPFLLDGIPPVVRGALANTCRYPHVFLHRLDSSGLFTRYENALPGLEKWIVDDSGDSEIEELQQASSEVASSCDKSADSNGKDRKSTRLNSSHQIISYAVFCLKKKNEKTHTPPYNSH